MCRIVSVGVHVCLSVCVCVHVLRVGVKCLRMCKLAGHEPSCAHVRVHVYVYSAMLLWCVSFCGGPNIVIVCWCVCVMCAAMFVVVYLSDVELMGVANQGCSVGIIVLPLSCRHVWVWLIVWSLGSSVI